jgi:hypothetical protein
MICWFILIQAHCRKLEASVTTSLTILCTLYQSDDEYGEY